MEAQTRGLPGSELPPLEGWYGFLDAAIDFSSIIKARTTLSPKWDRDSVGKGFICITSFNLWNNSIPSSLLPSLHYESLEANADCHLRPWSPHRISTQKRFMK